MPVANCDILYTFKYMIVIPGRLIGTFFAFAATVVCAYAGGDKEYGEYLSTECVTCHQAKDTDAKIPVLHGYDQESFVALMKAYRSGELENPTMITIAKRLTDEDVAALAAYYASLPEPD